MAGQALPAAPADAASTDAALADATLADRYGRRPGGDRARRGRYGQIVALVAFVVVTLTWAVWTVTVADRSAVHPRDGAFTRLDDGHARLTFEVRTSPGRRVVCTVRMFNQGMTEVGRTDVRAGPSERRTFSVTATVPTFEAATSGTVRACAVA